MTTELKFIRKEKKDGTFEGFEPKGEIKAGDERHLAAALNSMANRIRLRVDNDQRDTPLTPREIEGMAEATVMLEEVMRDFIMLDIDRAKEMIGQIRDLMEAAKRGN